MMITVIVVVFPTSVIRVHDFVLPHFHRVRRARAQAPTAQVSPIVKLHRCAHLFLAQLYYPILARTIRYDEPKMRHAVQRTFIYSREWLLGISLRFGGIHHVHGVGILLSHD